jgi:hypothetical protein
MVAYPYTLKKVHQNLNKELMNNPVVLAGAWQQISGIKEKKEQIYGLESNTNNRKSQTP